ncbi:MAG TPA: gliding motility-associated peptidyl-prolyl isomerase GldI [Aquaticitalea sp.]|nr:gliding motility-associated peptidyl-prolyl isomerase GldI [Aquaticitalea sp.]
MKRFLPIILPAIVLLGCKSPEAREPISYKTGSFINESVERNRKLNQKEEAKIKQIIEQDSLSEYLASETGFWYTYETKVEKDTITPGFGDVVNFDYNVKTLNGQTIYSDDEIVPRNYRMDKEELFTGLREGLKLMKPGETVTFLFPSQKAFGYYGDENRIGSNVPIMCEVTVNSIIKTQND